MHPNAALEISLIRLLCVIFLLAAALPVSAQSRYVSDELAIVLRGTPGPEGASLGVLTSGAQVELLESGAAGGYARVRSADGREGWVLERYLKDQPIARERLQRAENDLTAARRELAAAQKTLAEVQAELKKVKDENARLLKDFSRIADSSGSVPVVSADTQKEVEDLRAQVQRLEQEGAALRGLGGGLDEERMMMLGGALVAGGVLLALLLHWLWPKRRWGDL